MTEPTPTPSASAFNAVRNQITQQRLSVSQRNAQELRNMQEDSRARQAADLLRQQEQDYVQ